MDLYLTDPKLRSLSDDLIIYQPYQSPVGGSQDTALRFLKLSTTHLTPEIDDSHGNEGEGQPLRAIHDVENRSVVFVPGISPRFIIKSASSPPHVIGLSCGPVRSLSGFNTATCAQGFIYVDIQVRVLPETIFIIVF